MGGPDHAVRAHAILSASSADRWLACPPSARLNEQIPDERSEFAAYGTAMHELAERALIADRQAHEIEGPYDHEQRDAVQVYLDYVRAIPGERMIETRLSFEKWVMQGFGTCDAIVIDDGHMTVVDLKGGKGVRVDADDNAQLKLYALAAFDAYDPIWGPLHKVKLAIVQPRLDHIDEWEISTADLLDWAENTVKPIAALAWEGLGEFSSGDHCQFCKVRHTCRTRAEVNLAIAKDEMGEWCPPAANLSDAELAHLYPKLDGLVRWANDLSAYCLTRAEAGTRFDGLKLVEGRSNRCIVDGKDDEVIERLREQGLDDFEFMTQKLAGITALEKLLGKKEFAELLGDVVIKPSGKPTLVVATDKRPEYDPSQRQSAIAEMTNA